MKNVSMVFLAVAVMAAAPLAQAKKDAEDNKALPPGLQKKVERGGELPPGWKKKLEAGEVLDEQVYEAGTVIKKTDDYEDVQVEDKVIRVIKSTRRIAEILGTE